MLLRRMLIMLGVVLVVVLALAAYKGFSIYQQIQMFSAPQPAITPAVSAIARTRGRLIRSLPLDGLGHSAKAFGPANLGENQPAAPRCFG